jgi:hypothetical protein
MLVSRHGPPSHRLLVQFEEHGHVFQPGESVHYSGCPDWRFEPLKPKDLCAWSKMSDPARVAATLAAGEITYPENNQ